MKKKMARTLSVDDLMRPPSIGADLSVQGGMYRIPLIHNISLAS